jgi:photosystem II stability/assembly factor-like uncharacterized protein
VDGGVSWAVLDAGESGSFLGAVSFVNSTQGWIGGLDIAATGDGGMTWVHFPTEFLSFTGVTHLPTFLDARFVSQQHGAFVGNHRGGDVIFTTKNGGATFTIVQPHTNFASLQGVAFGDGNHFWAVGGFGLLSDRQGAIILASADGGVTWTDQVSPTSQVLNGVWFVNGSTGWAVGDNGVVIRTTNGGVAWTLLSGGS